MEMYNFKRFDIILPTIYAARFCVMSFASLKWRLSTYHNRKNSYSGAPEFSCRYECTSFVVKVHKVCHHYHTASLFCKNRYNTFPEFTTHLSNWVILHEYVSVYVYEHNTYYIRTTKQCCCASAKFSEFNLDHV